MQGTGLDTMANTKKTDDATCNTSASSNMIAYVLLEANVSCTQCRLVCATSGNGSTDSAALVEVQEGTAG